MYVPLKVILLKKNIMKNILNHVSLLNKGSFMKIKILVKRKIFIYNFLLD